MEPNTFPALRRECSCGCEYITIILHKPGFVDAEPKCPCCGVTHGKPPGMVICDHAGEPECNGCVHNAPHHYGKGLCEEEECAVTAITVHCIPVTDGKEG